jgi:excinuclease ABC subunit A
LIPNNGRTIELRGVRVHNLKSIDLDLPHHRLIVISGVSGSGKSSLAFDTLFAEGQRRYIETFSPYIRQFLETLDKPESDRIEGIPPAIAVAQRQVRRSARATVGSVTEIHDALAILYARVGRIFCPDCKTEVRPADPPAVVRAIEGLAAGTRYQVAFPIDLTGQSNAAALAEALREDGFLRIVAEGQALLLDSDAPLPGASSWDVVVDRLVRGSEAPQRRLDSIETAFQKGLGRCRILTETEALTFYRGWRCGSCGRDFPTPDPRRFRPNNPLGACDRCEGFGRVIDIDLDRIVPDPSKTLEHGAIVPWTTPAYREWNEAMLAWAKTEGIPIDRPFRLLTDAQQTRLRTGSGSFQGLEGFFHWLERKAYKMHVRVFLSRWRTYQPCPACEGARLRPESLAVQVHGKTIAEVSAMSVRDARDTLVAVSALADGGPVAQRLLASVLAKLGYLDQIGLGYLSLERPARTLSAGEARRVALTTALGSGLVNTLYVLDEPSLGLHPRDLDRLIGAMHRLRDEGNTLVVVDHEEAVMRSADVLVDIGPGAGEAGGRVLYVGPPAGVESATGSVTAEYLTGHIRVPIPHHRRTPSSAALRLLGARGHNLQNLDVAFPLGVFCVVTGVSGAGKSTLVEETLYPALLRRLKGEFTPALPYRELRGVNAVDDVTLIDQSPIGRTPRSNPITYLKAFDEIRRTFSGTHEAKLRNYGPSQFSFNVEGGRCNACEGNGYQMVDMQFLSDVLVRCPECRGRRFRVETLEVTYRGKNIAEVLELTAREAFGFFRNRPKVQARLRPLIDVGLDYLRLGQPANTLSGGEAQRLKLAAHLAESPLGTPTTGRGSKLLFVMDEPTTGLHPFDVSRLLECLHALADRGHSLIVVEHSPEVMAAADWLIELGPEAGDGGGRLVAQGTPEDVARLDTATGRVLAHILRERLQDADDNRSA